MYFNFFLINIDEYYDTFSYFVMTYFFNNNNIFWVTGISVNWESEN